MQKSLFILIFLLSPLLGHADGYLSLNDLHNNYLSLLHKSPSQTVVKINTKYKSLKLNSEDQEVNKLRLRLSQLGYKIPETGPFDELVENAIKAYQKKLGIEADGKAGPLTLYNLNLTNDEKAKILQSQLNEMEQISELTNQEKFILINIPAFKLYAFENGKMVLESKIIVGRSDRQTPIMDTKITSVIINPTWTPPHTIVEKDLFKKGAFNWDAFKEHNLVAYDESNNPIELDPQVSLSEIKQQRIKFTQPAGKQNPLGRLKFQLSESDDVYMHDTNSHGLFSVYNRNFSSGCIRVEKYMDLSSWVLNEPKNKIESLISKNATISIPAKKIPVKTVYWLAENTGDETLYHLDIYNRSK